MPGPGYINISGTADFDGSYVEAWIGLSGTYGDNDTVPLSDITYLSVYIGVPGGNPTEFSMSNNDATYYFDAVPSGTPSTPVGQFHDNNQPFFEISIQGLRRSDDASKVRFDFDGWGAEDSGIFAQIVPDPDEPGLIFALGSEEPSDFVEEIPSGGPRPTRRNFYGFSPGVGAGSGPTAGPAGLAVDESQREPPGGTGFAVTAIVEPAGTEFDPYGGRRAGRPGLMQLIL